MKLLLKDIFLSFFPMELPIVLLCCGTDTGQAHLPHQLGYILPADPMIPLHKNGADLIGTEHLPILIKYLVDQNAVFLPAFLKPGVAALVAENVVIECAAGNIKSFAKRVDIILAIEQF